MTYTDETKGHRMTESARAFRLEYVEAALVDAKARIEVEYAEVCRLKNENAQLTSTVAKLKAVKLSVMSRPIKIELNVTEAELVQRAEKAEAEVTKLKAVLERREKSTKPAWRDLDLVEVGEGADVKVWRCQKNKLGSFGVSGGRRIEVGEMYWVQVGPGSTSAGRMPLADIDAMNPRLAFRMPYER